MVLDIKIPAIQNLGYPTNQRENILSKLNLIEKNFGSIITIVSKVTNVPSEIIKSVIFIESGGNKDIESFICKKVTSAQCPVGLMQINPETATNVLYKENRDGRLSEAEKNLFYKWVGKAKTDCILSMQYYNQKKSCNNNTGVSFTKAELKDPKINILVCSILLGQYIDIFTEGGKIRFDKVIIAYNKSLRTAKKITGTIEQAVTKLPKETAQYIYKLMGVNSTLDILV